MLARALLELEPRKELSNIEIQLSRVNMDFRELFALQGRFVRLYNLADITGEDVSDFIELYNEIVRQRKLYIGLELMKPYLTHV